LTTLIFSVFGKWIIGCGTHKTSFKTMVKTGNFVPFSKYRFKSNALVRFINCDFKFRVFCRAFLR
jgi:hypothetical protein